MKKRGTSFLEYAVLVATVALALVAVSVVVRRAISGSWRQAVDVFGHGAIYSPGNISE